MSSSVDQFMETVTAKFEDLNVSYQELDYNGKIPVFFVRCLSLEVLEANWTKLIDVIAFDFQSQLIDEFQIWNIYVFFVQPAGLTDMARYNRLKLKIENDTFSSRKILVEDNPFNEIINEHIINRNLRFSPDQIEEPSAEFEANQVLWSILEHKVLKKQRMTDEAGSVFDELVKKLRPSSQ